MITKVLVFGAARDMCGSSAINVDWSGGTVEELKSALVLMYPALAGLRSFALAVNGTYAVAGAAVLPGYEVAIIPPVSGG